MFVHSYLGMLKRFNIEPYAFWDIHLALEVLFTDFIALGHPLGNSASPHRSHFDAGSLPAVA
jgi:hypothetical protein